MPNTGDVWVKRPDGTWAKSGMPPYAKTSTGWHRITAIYAKTGSSTWTQRYSRDLTPPAPPVSMSFAMSGTTLNVSVKAPATADVATIVLQWSFTGYHGSQYEQPRAGINVTPNQTVTFSYPSQKSGESYYWTAWAVDSSGNTSTALTGRYTVPNLYVPPTLVTKVAYLYPSSSATYVQDGSYWRSDSNFVYQGGLNQYGQWFYDTRIIAALIKAKHVLDMRIQITRANTVHGVSGPAGVYLTAHTLANQPAGNPAGSNTPSLYVGTLNRGETKTFEVPSSYYAGFLSKQYKGFGLYAGETSYVDPKYLYALGAGSPSGKLYVQWQE
jgi:hypothetical protein